MKNPIATQEIQLKRLEICQQCPNLEKKHQKCKECGCYLTYKVWLNNSKCPLNKW